MDDPNSSRPAKYISMFVMVIIALSVTNFIVGTEITPRCGWISKGSAPDDVDYECGDGKLSDTGVSADVLNALETVCIMVFTVEYVLRILTCTTSMSLVSFIFAPMNVIDLVAILPYYLDLILAAARQRGENATSLGSARSRRLRLIGARACRLWAAPGLVAAPPGAPPPDAPPPPHMLERAVPCRLQGRRLRRLFFS